MTSIPCPRRTAIAAATSAASFGLGGVNRSLLISTRGVPAPSPRTLGHSLLMWKFLQEKNPDLPRQAWRNLVAEARDDHVGKAPGALAHARRTPEPN